MITIWLFNTFEMSTPTLQFCFSLFCTMFCFSILLDSDSGGFDYYSINLDVKNEKYNFNPLLNHMVVIPGFPNVRTTLIEQNKNSFTFDWLLKKKEILVIIVISTLTNMKTNDTERSWWICFIPRPKCIFLQRFVCSSVLSLLFKSFGFFYLVFIQTGRYIWLTDHIFGFTNKTVILLKNKNILSGLHFCLKETI